MLSSLGALFVVGIQGTELTEQEKTFIVDNNIGGVILFTRNLESPQQVFELCQEIQSLSKKTPDQMPLWIGIDMEGGRVQRLKAPFTPWPSLRNLAETEKTAEYSQAMAKELTALGINLNFSPCTDILTNKKNALIGDRSAGTETALVADVTTQVHLNFQKEELFSCAKHFPGHGNTITDSHIDLPFDDTTTEIMDTREWVPYKKLIKLDLPFIMTAHIQYTAIDPERPATLSKKILKEILREQLGYKGLIISDDLDMQALTKNYASEHIPVLALKAGCNILLYCNKPKSPYAALEAVSKVMESDKELVKIVKENHKLVKTWKKKIKIDPELSAAKALDQIKKSAEFTESLSLNP